MGKTNFDRITASPEALASFLASLPAWTRHGMTIFTGFSATTAPWRTAPRYAPTRKKTAPRGGWGWRCRKMKKG